MIETLLHGGALDRMRAMFPKAPGPWVDLSTGINPWPYPFTEISPDAYSHLPTEHERLACRAAMADAISAPHHSLCLSPGSELLIRLLPALISPGRVAVQSPTYGDHGRVWQAAGCEVIEAQNPLNEAGRVDAVIVCNPNNPDGHVFDTEELEFARKKLAVHGGWLIVDEAYADLAPMHSLAPMGGADHLIILRSFGKFYGLAGIRLGGLIGPESIVRKTSEHLGVWPVSGPALSIGTEAYMDLHWQNATRHKLWTARQRLDALLTDAGLNIIGGCDLFRLVETEDAGRLWRNLAERGVYVRRFDWSDQLLRFGLPSGHEAERRLKDALNL